MEETVVVLLNIFCFVDSDKNTHQFSAVSLYIYNPPLRPFSVSEPHIESGDMHIR